MKKEPEVDLTVLRCHHCSAKEGIHCMRCHNTRSVFWVDGRSFPYTPAGERDARATLKTNSPISPSLASLIKAGMA